MIAWLLAVPVLRFGVADIDISPPEPLPLGGYTARQGKTSEPGGKPLLARVLVLKQGDSTLAIASLDMLTVPESLYEEVAKRLPGIKALFLVATHTHSAPDSQMLNRRMNFAVPGIASFRERWLEWYADRIAKGILSTKPTQSISELRIEERRLAANKGRRAGAVPDTLGSRLSSGSNHLLFHYAAHATVLDERNLKTDPDWPGLVRDWGALLPGAIGDVAPASGELGDMRKLLRKPVPYIESVVWNQKQYSFAYVETQIGLDAVSANPAFAAQNKIPAALATTLVSKFAPSIGKVSAFRLGKLAVVGIPGEPTSAIGRDIRDYGRRIGFTSVLVVSHVNGWIGYILKPDDYDRGGYEASLAFHGRLTGDKVTEAAESALNQLAGRP
ncbi:MAG TPA: hypothetical protein PKA27_03025 [Fimbriimonadaceae bacterium]|nr:hypothetical protein [Fimbriimonadaceae bacterium]